MGISRFFIAAGLTAGACLACPRSAPAGNVLYNFNANDGGWTVTSGSLTPPEQPWEWTGGPSVDEGGWQARRGNEGAGTGTYLQSPCLVVDNVGGSYVRMDIRHRFDFGPASAPLALGQVQYRINDGDWLGIRTSDFSSTAGKIPPSYANPPAPFIDTTSVPSGKPYGVEAWVGTTDKFDQGDHQISQFTLDFPPYPLGPGDEIQFRFLMGTQVSSTKPQIDWEINRVQIDGVYECPEPAGIALALIGGLSCLLAGRVRRSCRNLVAARGMRRLVVGGIALACAGMFVAASAVRAEVVYNFDLSNGGWTASTSGPVLASNRWTYASGSSPNHWGMKASGVDSISVATGNILTSPTFSGIVDGVPAKSARISLSHNFYLPPSGVGGPTPIATGQIEYRLNGAGAWIGLPLAAFTSGSSVLVDDPIFGPSPFKDPLDPTKTRYVDQTAFVAATYLTPTGTSAVPILAPGGASFVGMSTGYATKYVPSQAFLDTATGLPSSGITSLAVRLVEANFGASCPTNAGWNARFVQVDFSSTDTPLPEPGTIVLCATGALSIFAARSFRKGLHHRPSSPSVSPCTTTLPPVSVAPMIGLSGQSIWWANWLGAMASPPSQKMA